MLFQLTIAKNWGQEVNTISCVKKQCYWYQLLLIPVNWNKDSWHLNPACRGSETSPPQFEHNEEHKCYPTHCWWGHQDRLYQHHRSHCSALWHCLADSFPLLCQEYQGMAEIEVRGRRRESRQSTSLSASAIIHCCNENVSGVQSFRKPKILTNSNISFRGSDSTRFCAERMKVSATYRKPGSDEMSYINQLPLLPRKNTTLLFSDKDIFPITQQELKSYFTFKSIHKSNWSWDSVWITRKDKWSDLTNWGHYGPKYSTCEFSVSS